jgi:hypothetical protein
MQSWHRLCSTYCSNVQRAALLTTSAAEQQQFGHLHGNRYHTLPAGSAGVAGARAHGLGYGYCTMCCLKACPLLASLRAAVAELSAQPWRSSARSKLEVQKSSLQARGRHWITTAQQGPANRLHL